MIRLFRSRLPPKRGLERNTRHAGWPRSAVRQLLLFPKQPDKAAGLWARLLALALSILLAAHPGLAAAQALVLENKILLGPVLGRIDHLAADPVRGRVFVAELGNNSLGIVDLLHGRFLHRIDRLNQPQGVGYAPATDMIYVADGGDGMLHRFQGSSFSPAGDLKLGEDADNVRVDRRSNRVVVGYGAGALAIIDAATGRRTADIPLAGHPESFQFETSGARVFVNVPDAGQIAIVDRSRGRQVGAWETGDARENFPMALDNSGQRLAVAFRQSPELRIFETRHGSVAARVPSCGDADDIFFDDKRQRLYVSCGEGLVQIVQRRGDRYVEAERLNTVRGARTALFVPELDRYVLAVRATDGESAALWVFRPLP